MSRRADENDGSLELLLDTICNTFGGVLFISILVVLLLNLSSNEAAMTPPSEASQAELIDWETRLAQTNDEIQGLETALRQQELTERQIVDPGLKDTVRMLRQSQQQGTGMVQRKTEILSQISRSQIEVNKITQAMKLLADELDNTQQSLEQVERQLQREIASRTRAAKLPRARRTQKKEVVLFLRNGRLSSYTKRGERGVLEPNVDDFVEKQDENQKPYVEPKPGAGIRVDAQGRNTGEIDAKLNDFDSDEHYLAVFVWPDSFEHFAIIKDRMVSKAFEYRLEPFPEDGKIYIGGTPVPVLVQ